jgi:hypothetical protein
MIALEEFYVCCDCDDIVEAHLAHRQSCTCHPWGGANLICYEPGDDVPAYVATAAREYGFVGDPPPMRDDDILSPGWEATHDRDSARQKNL